jgi:hypothetical protein
MTMGGSCGNGSGGRSKRSQRHRQQAALSCDRFIRAALGVWDRLLDAVIEVSWESSTG